jgi:hypothetical protein
MSLRHGHTKPIPLEAWLAHNTERRQLINEAWRMEEIQVKYWVFGCPLLKLLRHANPLLYILSGQPWCRSIEAVWPEDNHDNDHFDYSKLEIGLRMLKDRLKVEYGMVISLLALTSLDILP